MDKSNVKQAVLTSIANDFTEIHFTSLTNFCKSDPRYIKWSNLL